MTHLETVTGKPQIKSQCQITNLMTKRWLCVNVNQKFSACLEQQSYYEVHEGAVEVQIYVGKGLGEVFRWTGVDTAISECFLNASGKWGKKGITEQNNANF